MATLSGYERRRQVQEWHGKQLVCPHPLPVFKQPFNSCEGSETRLTRDWSGGGGGGIRLSDS